MGTSSTGISREAFISNVARDIAGKIPEPFDTQLLKKSIGVPSPTQVVLLQETERWNQVSLCLLPLFAKNASAAISFMTIAAFVHHSNLSSLSWRQAHHSNFHISIPKVTGATGYKQRREP